jgi:hypothetical protein
MRKIHRRKKSIVAKNPSGVETIVGEFSLVYPFFEKIDQQYTT